MENKYKIKKLTFIDAFGNQNTLPKQNIKTIKIKGDVLIIFEIFEIYKLNKEISNWSDFI